MLLTAPERRKIVVLSGDRRVDAAVPLDDSLRSALAALGYRLEPGRHAVLDRTGAEADLDAPGADLQDGALFSIVDLHATSPGRADVATAVAERRDDKGALWWLIGTLAVVLAIVALLDAAGAVPLALRFLPSTLVNVPEGHHINYRHFMSNRWTVRGDVPESPDAIELGPVRDVVDASSARLVTGVVLLAVTAAVFLPLALAGPLPEGGFVSGGAIALVATLTISLLLSPRHYATPVLRWAPRAACAVVVLAAAVAITAMFGDAVVLVVAAGLLVTGIAAAVLLVPIGRGARSLAWSRLADFFEWMAVAFSLPAGLLAADVLNALRGMMST